MSETQSAETVMPNPRKPRKLAIFGMGLLFFVFLAIAAIILCNFRVEYVTQSILNQQRDAQQTWLDKSLDAIRVWRNQLLEQARYVSTAELFRLFVLDTKSLTPGERDLLADPDTLHSHDDTLRAMAEQLTYIQDLLKDFTRRRAWSDARILLPDGSKLVEPRFSGILTKAQSDLAREAGAVGHTVFGPIRQGEKGFAMDVAEPLFEVLGAENVKPVAVLLLTVPMDKPLATFLSRNGEHRQTLLPRLVFKNGDSNEMALSVAGDVKIEPLGVAVKIQNMPFGLHPALDGHGDAYSLGGTITTPNWLFALETPAGEVAAIIHDQKVQIYGLGILASLGIALLAAFLWAALTSRSHEARARYLEKLYTTIRNQKLMLDSVNSSMRAGLLLVDAHDRAQMSNPAFDEIFGQKELAQNTPVTDFMPGAEAIKFREKVAEVRNSGNASDMELNIPGKDAAGAEQDHVFRVSLFPFSESGGAVAGCVAIFQDITVHRQRAMRDRERQTALISALGRAIESVDPNLVGHSDKMASVAALLSRDDSLNLSDSEKETLRLAARLSQVGRIFIPRELLTKKDITPEEKKIIAQATSEGDKILGQLHFGLPVRETVAMMGKPQGAQAPAPESASPLDSAQIARVGQALSIVNAFIGMTSPRAWRAGMSIQEALATLKKEGRFDSGLIAALASVPEADLAKAIGLAAQAK